MNDKKEKSMFDSITDDYKEAGLSLFNDYKSLFTSDHNDKTSTKRNSMNLGLSNVNNIKIPKTFDYELDFINKIGLLFYKFYKLPLFIYSKNRFFNIVNVLISIIRDFMCILLIYIPLNLISKFLLHKYNLNNYMIQSEEICLITSIGVFMVTKILSNISSKEYYKLQFQKIGFVSCGLIPTFKEMKIDKTKRQYKKIFNKYNISSYNIDYTFKTVIPLIKWIENKMNLEMALNTHIINIKHGKSLNDIIISTNKVESLNIEVLEPINYKDTKLNINDRVKTIFEIDNIDYEYGDMVNSRFGTLIYFNSSLNYNSLMSYQTELRHKLKINNLLVGTSNVDQFDYMMKIIKKIDVIHFLEYYEMIKDKLDDYYLPISLGLSVNGNVDIIDYVDNYHTIIAGTVGSGKTRGIHALLSMLLIANKNTCYFIIDVKRDMGMYKNIDNVCYITNENISDVINLLTILVEEMKRRNKMFSEYDDFCDSIETYNEETCNDLPYIVLMIDEIAQLLTCSESDHIEDLLVELCQLGRSAGYRVFLSTQKPTADVITTRIKSLCDNKMCFRVVNKRDSLNVLDRTEASGIKQKGEYYFSNGDKFENFKALYINKDEHRKVIQMVKDKEKLLISNDENNL